MNALFEISGLSIQLVGANNGVPLIEDFSLQVDAGQIVGLVGETGAGKSLAVRASVGLLPDGVRANTGFVAMKGSSPAPIAETKSLRANLGHGIVLLLQNARGALNPFLRVNAQIERVLKRHAISAGMRSARITELLSMVGLAPDIFLSRYPHELSGGQAQRVAMAIALATEPSLLIADEPTTALDVTTEREVISLLEGICRERNMGLLLITHNLALVFQTCDYVAIMHAGHIVEQGSVRDVFARPMHPYTVGLLQAIPDVDQPRELVPLIGTVPALGAVGASCRFSTRCEHVWDRCRESVPPLYQKGSSRVRCFLYDDQDDEK